MRIQSTLFAGVLAIGAAVASGQWLPSAFATSQDEEKPQEVVGMAATEIEVATWFNNIGADPSLDNLKGKVWIAEMWATW